MFVFVTIVSNGQNTPFLERVVTITFQQERVDAALIKLSKQGGFTFSYSPTVVEAGRVVSYTFVNKTVREILDQLFNGTIQYKEKGKYLILTRSQLGSKNDKQVFSGYIVDESTGERLRDVTVYDPVSLSSATTNAFGYFELKMERPPTDFKLAVNKKNYSDTVVVVPSRNGRLLNIPIRVNKEHFRTFADSVQSKAVRFWNKTKLLTRQRLLVLENVQDTLHRKVQVSFVPYVGTNHALSGNVVNKYSYNILGGISRGTEKLELGGIFNIDIADVRGAQLAGVFNIVGGSTQGFQGSGIFNANRGVMDGAQLAGVINLNLSGARKFAAAGVLNVSAASSSAVQLAGVGNLTAGDQTLPHLAGVFNVTSGSAQSQAAGTFNIAGKDVRGAQASGVFNLAGKNVHGAQVAGVFNLAGKEVRGAQLAGVINYAKKVRGVQIGLINISDTIKGVPIGLMSIVWKGYHKLEISTDEIFYGNIAFRTGVRQFYNIITAGVKPSTLKGDSTFWSFGYGVGTAPKLSRKLYLNVDLISNQLVQGGKVEKLNMLNKAYVGIDYQFAKKMSLTFGATLNAYTTDLNKDNYWNLFGDYKPSFISDETSSHYRTRMWIGGKIGLRFL